MSSKRNAESLSGRRQSVTSLEKRLSDGGRSSNSVLRSRGSFSRHDSISAKAYRSVTPAASLLLQKKWDELKYTEHRQKVQNYIYYYGNTNSRGLLITQNGIDFKGMV